MTKSKKLNIFLYDISIILIVYENIKTMNVLNGIFSSAFEAKRAAFESEKAAFEAKEEAFEYEKAALESERAAFESEKAAFESEKAAFESERAALEAREKAFESEKATFETRLKSAQARFKEEQAAIKQEKKKMEDAKISLYKQLDDELKQLFAIIKNPLNKKQKEIEEKNLSVERLKNEILKISNKKTVDEFDCDEIDSLNDKIYDLNKDIKTCEIAFKYINEVWIIIRDMYQLKSNKRT
jgi:chromosome segregation ATPase